MRLTNSREVQVDCLDATTAHQNNLQKERRYDMRKEYNDRWNAPLVNPGVTLEDYEKSRQDDAEEKPRSYLVEESQLELFEQDEEHYERA